MQSKQQNTTNNAGAPVASDEHSLTVGQEGPIALHDHYLVEKLAQFNRERIPERVVHAKGGGAFGKLVVTKDLSAYTKAALFQPDVTTEMLARFSSVAGESGSPDTWRDPRGFALKFYTTEGNYDIVGNNTPVFFLRDPMKFPDFIRSQKRLPGSHLRNNDMQWDFWTLSPETAHQVTWLMGDRGIPASWRHQDGFGSHTYQWINAAGEKFWVKYHFKTNQGIKNLTQSEANKIAGENADYFIQDLWDSIEKKQFPSWTLHVQIMPHADAKKYRFNPFDLTKVWSQKDYPLQELAVMTLHKNPDNYFAQIEQATFSPANFVPGVGPSPDKMLLGRIFSYPDAHRYRVGTNHAQLQVNAPKNEVHSYSKDGAMRQSFQAATAPVYHPNSFGGPSALQQTGVAEDNWETSGEMLRDVYKTHENDDNFGQAGTLVREVLDDAARARLVDNIVGHVLGVTNLEIRERVFEYWGNVDQSLGEKVKAKVLGN